MAERLASIFFDTLREYRAHGKFAVHAYVLMPEHFHLIFTPAADVTLERAMQLIKGGSSYRMNLQGGFHGEVWQRGFVDHRIRDEQDYLRHREYTHRNPVRRGLVTAPGEYRFSSACSGCILAVDEWAPAAKAAEALVGV